MPYRLVWEDAPKDESLPVLKELPEGIEEDAFILRWHSKRRKVHVVINGEFVQYHYCPECGGWIPGDYYEASVNTLDTRHLAGLHGTEYYCRRCGYQVAFEGMMS